MTKLPKTWEVKTLGEVCDIFGGYTPKKQDLNSNKSGKPYFKVSDMNHEDNELYLQTTKSYLITHKFFRKNSVVFPKNGGAIYTNKKRILNQDSVVDLNTCVMTPKNFTHNMFLFFFIENINLSKYTKGSAVPTIDMDRFKQIKIPLPPIETQKQIVEILDFKFAKIENATNALNLVKKDLVKLKASLLNSAFNGTLLEMSSQEATATKQSTNNTESTLPHLPQDWEVKTLGEVAFVQNGFAFKSKEYQDNGTNIIRISDIKNNQVDITDSVKTQEKLPSEFEIHKGDLLIAMSGATTGKTGVYQYEFFSYLNQRVGNIKILKKDILLDKFRNYFFMNIKKEIENLAYGGAQPNISKPMLENLKIPLPPLDTQKQIVEILESKFKGIEKLDYFVNDSLDKLSKLKASLLNKAFSGELVC
ncbi:MULTISPECIES: restriction endonuclease subunit S [unclassified Helicobacter]|uniref:restriction endonuclease subunit S n=1 Tax=unclassified Helicobacter TaxID=2593540 RepID=UPI0015F19808|nr:MULTISPECIES: restriction endonuclease subunit S [unclassified Helicobacter]